MSQSPAQQGSSVTGPFLDRASTPAVSQFLSPAGALSLPRDPVVRGPEGSGEPNKAIGQRKLAWGCWVWR